MFVQKKNYVTVLQSGNLDRFKRATDSLSLKNANEAFLGLISIRFFQLFEKW